MSTGLTIALYILSLLIPVAGIIIGIVYMTRDSPEEKRVGKICLIIGILAILLSVGLAAVLYVMVLGFGTDGGMLTPTTDLTKTAVADGYRFTFGTVNTVIPWSDVEIVLNDGQDAVSWPLESSDLTGSGAMTHTFAPAVISSIDVTLSVTDLDGNGYIDRWDYFTLVSSTGFSATTTYSVQVIYQPTAQAICSVYFVG